MKTYQAQYTDRFGQERTTIQNDGRLLTMTVRGVRFEGTDFDGFEPDAAIEPSRLESFTLSCGSLSYCVIEADIPVPVATPGGTSDGVLSFRLELGEPLPNGRVNGEHLRLRLAVDGRTFASLGKSGWFEDELHDLQGRLPPGTYMKACINCSFSDYHPGGHGSFGGMICFRTNKAGYLGLSTGREFTKAAYFAVIGTAPEFVQETHLCPEFERCKPGTGYRG